LKAYYLINGEVNPISECVRLGELINKHPIDVAFVGIGENGHLAFNDPPADFQTEQPYIIVNLDHACQMQQLGEGWFPNLEAVPHQAISMSIRQIMKSKAIICSVPDSRKALAIKNCVEGPTTPDHPASILKSHSHYHLFLDQGSSSLLSAL
jgi:glucosamine-6-phosphate deaminase